MSADDAELRGWLADTRVWAERQLGRLVPGEDTHPELLHRAMRYAVFGGGKRLRPAVVRLACRSAGGSDQDAERPAAAIELVHTYSLVHDDLPCMDDGTLRRGRPTCHLAFDEATAVLAGDALLTLAFEVLAGHERGRGAELVRVLAADAGARGMVGGQVLDLALERSRDPGAGNDLVLLLDMHARKTAALFAAAAEMGAVAAGAEEPVRRRARSFGEAVGRLFQVVDDLLDVTGDRARLGKTPGRDASLQRSTIVSAVGLERGGELADELAGAARDAARRLGGGTAGLAGTMVDHLLARQA